MLPTEDKRIPQCAEKSVQSFRRAIPLLDYKVVVLEIPYEDKFVLPRYLYLPPVSKKLRGSRRTSVIFNCGDADSTQEELYFMFGATGPQLGYAVLKFEGPGQGMVLKTSN